MIGSNETQMGWGDMRCTMRVRTQQLQMALKRAEARAPMVEAEGAG